MKLNAYDFIKNTYEGIESLSKEEYFSRKRPETKYLLNEQLPIASFLAYLVRPGLTIHCEHIIGNQGHDAELRLSGHWVENGTFKPHYFIEVTVAVPENDYLTRELLATEGMALNDLKRDPKTKQIVQNAKAVDTDFFETQLADLVAKRIRAKTVNSYSSDTILLIAAEDIKPISPERWSELKNSFQYEQGRFSMIYIIQPFRKIIFQLEA